MSGVLPSRRHADSGRLAELRRRGGSRRHKAAQKAGLFGAVIGLAAAGVASGVAIERYLVKRNRTPEHDPYLDEPFGALPFDQELVVTMNDGVELYVNVIDPPGEAPPDLTAVFVHGFCLDMGTFHFQRRTLTELVHGGSPEAPRLRMVFYDQPGHGESGRLGAGQYTIDALGHGLDRVIEETAPTGPLVLVGHSMGGMTIMALAEQRPELVAERVLGVALISTSAGELETVNWGLPNLMTRVRGRLMPVATEAMKLAPAAIDRARQASTDLAWLLTKRFGFGSERPSPSLVSYVEKMNASTSMEVVAGYVSTLYDHKRYDALAVLRTLDVVVICGDADHVTPLEHSAEMVRRLPEFALVTIPGGGHCALLEYHEQVTAPVLELLRRAAGSPRAAALRKATRRGRGPLARTNRRLGMLRRGERGRRVDRGEEAV